MRSQRSYQQAFPTDRILAVLQQNDGSRFDQRLVRRFSQLHGHLPVGNLVRLDTGALAVVLHVHAPDPSRPMVRVVVGPDGARLATPVDLALWADERPGRPAAPHRAPGRPGRRRHRPAAASSTTPRRRSGSRPARSAQARSAARSLDTAAGVA